MGVCVGGGGGRRDGSQGGEFNRHSVHGADTVKCVCVEGGEGGTGDASQGGEFNRHSVDGADTVTVFSGMGGC